MAQGEPGQADGGAAPPGGPPDAVRPGEFGVLGGRWPTGGPPGSPRRRRRSRGRCRPTALPGTGRGPGRGWHPRPAEESTRYSWAVPSTSADRTTTGAASGRRRSVMTSSSTWIRPKWVRGLAWNGLRSPTGRRDSTSRARSVRTSGRSGQTAVNEVSTVRSLRVQDDRRGGPGGLAPGAGPGGQSHGDTSDRRER